MTPMPGKVARPGTSPIRPSMAFLALFCRESSKQTCLQPDSGVYSIETSEARPQTSMPARGPDDDLMRERRSAPRQPASSDRDDVELGEEDFGGGLMTAKPCVAGRRPGSTSAAKALPRVRMSACPKHGQKGPLKTLCKEADERWMKSRPGRYLPVPMKLCSPHACGRTNPMRRAARGLPRTLRDSRHFGARGSARSGWRIENSSALACSPTGPPQGILTSPYFASACSRRASTSLVRPSRPFRRN
jgi:hypothetical protein